MDARIDFNAIKRSCGCDNCVHEDDGRWDDYCRICNPDYIPPSKYRPVRGTIQEKYYYDHWEEVTYSEYLRFLKDEA